MVFSQYGNLFSLYIFTVLLIPGIILALLGKSIKWYGILVSIPALCLIMGLNSLQMLQFLIFICLETILIMSYFYFHKKVKHEYLYYSVFILSMIPIIIIKLSVYTKADFLGFLGISYVSFRVWQLIIEIHDNHIDKLSLPSMLYFITFFPTLSSGPIDRYNRFLQNINEHIPRQQYLYDYLLIGIKRIGMGILYKYIFAFLINTYIISKLTTEITFFNTIIYMYAYTIYLFFDFAGYTNFAIGTSYFLGIKCPENFNKPFLAHNMKEFWDRWHISLSKWFGDYVFSRFVLSTLRSGVFKSKKKATRWGYMVTMTLMGVWHGAYIFYVLYGVYQGVMLVVTDIYLKSSIYKKFKKKNYYDILSRIVCFQFISFGMLLFSGYLFSV